MLPKRKHFSFLANPYSKAWYLVATIVSLMLLAFVILNTYISEYQLKFPLQGLFLTEGDTSTYYGPLENIIKGNGYNSICRMPALLPIYIPLRWFFNMFWAKNIIVLLQIATNIVAGVLLSRIAYELTKKRAVFYITLGLYVTSFIIIKLSHMGYMDSFAISTLIIGYHFIICRKWTPLNFLIAGLFFGWSIFFRQILGLNLLFLTLHIFFALLAANSIKFTILKTAVFLSPFITALLIWNLYTLTTFQKTPILVQKGELCWSGYPPHLNKVVQLAIAWGGNFTKWNGEAEWFITNNMKEQDFPFSKKVMTQAYNIDSLILLRRNLLSTLNTEMPIDKKEILIEQVSKTAIEYKNAYIEEKPFRYFFINKLILLRKFIIPRQLDGLILPPLKQMNILQIALKSFWWFSFAIVNVLGLLGFILFFNKKQGRDIWLHLSFMFGFFYLVFYAGLIEQRYIAPYLPFIYIYCAHLISRAWIIITKKLTSSLEETNSSKNINKL